MVDAAETVAAPRNPVYRPNSLFTTEDLNAPRFKGLRERYRLDDVVKGETDEFRRILQLRNWLNRHVKIDRSKPTARADDALAMLEKSPDGGAYSCGHFSRMQNAVLNAMGYVTRQIFAAAGEKEKRLSGAHGINEVWLNSRCKWVMLDAELDSHFEKDGVPLSALEIRDEVLRDGGKLVYRFRGPGRERLPKGRDDTWGHTPRTFAWASWYPEGNVHSIWPKRRSGYEYVYDDDYWRTHTWYRNGKRHWAYDANHFKPVKDRAAIEWTPNVLDVKAEVRDGAAEIRIASHTPNLKEYQIKVLDGDWKPVSATFTIRLTAKREQRLLRAMNLAGVAGPVYRLVIERP